MNFIKKSSLLLIACFLLVTPGSIKSSNSLDKQLQAPAAPEISAVPLLVVSELIPKEKKHRQLGYTFTTRFKPGDSLYAKNITLLNNCVPQDRFLRIRHTLDLNLTLKYGYEIPVAKVKFSLRNRAVWGNPKVIPTTDAEPKLIDFVGFRHKHFLPRHVSWLREAWLKISINELSGIAFDGKRQTFTLGAFPFQLGRGIALGDAYAVGPDYVGFYSDTVVDQYAFGAKLTGHIIKNKLKYDIYGGILRNFTASLSDTGEKIFAQEYRRRDHPERGFGIVNIVIAGRLRWKAFCSKTRGILNLQPYFLVNTDKEQKIEFRGDATSKLGTIGLAVEYEQEKIEFGFDCAANLGHQCIKGWDRNIISIQNRNGKLYFTNSHVLIGIDPTSQAAKGVNTNPYLVPQAAVTLSAGEINNVGSKAQTIINNSPQTATQNGKFIGKVEGFTDTIGDIPNPKPLDPNLIDAFFNKKDRFRDPYENQYEGVMIVVDAAVYFKERDLRIAGTIGFASGDADPNFEQKDGDYQGFIPLQELYAGKRVESAFYMGGQGRLRLPLDTQTTEEKPNRLAARTSGFTNLAFVGAGVKWEPHEWKKFFSVNPNVLLYWQPFPSKKFDCKNSKFLISQARAYLGTEVNVFMDKELFENLKFYLIWSIFFPGGHFDDIKGKPFTKKQLKILDRKDRTGFAKDRIPTIGTDIALAFNVGFDYRF